MELKNRIIVITGGSKGLGKELARLLVGEKAKVVISARSVLALKAASRETGALSYQADVAKEADMEKLARFARKKFGRLDIWINNAGTYFPQSPVEAIDSKSAHELMEINFFGTFNGSRAALKIFNKQKRGVIVNIGSQSAFVGRPLSAVYAASKWAVRGLNESLRLALAPKNISVLAAHPGGMKTTIFGKAKPVGYDDWLEPAYVAEKIVRNLKKKKPQTEMIIDK